MGKQSTKTGQRKESVAPGRRPGCRHVLTALAESELPLRGRIATGGRGDDFLQFLHFLHSSLGGILTVGPEVMPRLPSSQTDQHPGSESPFPLACGLDSRRRFDPMPAVTLSQWKSIIPLIFALSSNSPVNLTCLSAD